MKSNKNQMADVVTISRSHWDVPIRVSLNSYLDFSRAIDRGLLDLMAQWSDTAAPNAKHAGKPQGRRRFA